MPGTRAVRAGRRRDGDRAASDPGWAAGPAAAGVTVAHVPGPGAPGSLDRARVSATGTWRRAAGPGARAQPGATEPEWHRADSGLEGLVTPMTQAVIIRGIDLPVVTVESLAP